jgi:hypothetical protein
LTFACAQAALSGDCAAQAPLSRFGDTAANTGVLALFAITAPGVPVPVATAFASAAGAGWRLLLTPLDTLKTARQVVGGEADGLLRKKVSARGVTSLYDGALANAAASWLGRCGSAARRRGMACELTRLQRRPRQLPVVRHVQRAAGVVAARRRHHGARAQVCA